MTAISFIPAEERDAPLEPGLAAPSGDRFDDPYIIQGLIGEFKATFIGATTETGETLPTGVSKTLWFTWTVTDDIDFPRVMLDTSFASIVVGTGDSLSTFAPVWSGEGGIPVYPVLGTKYMIQLGWHTGDPNEVDLIWDGEESPFYDNFVTPYELSGNWDRVTLSTDFCTIETGESVPGGTQTTAWARWQPDNAGDAVIEATKPDLILNVFEDGVDITSLTSVASGTGSVSFTASLPSYLIQICDTSEPGS